MLCGMRVLCPGTFVCSQFANSQSQCVSCSSSTCEFVTTSVEYDSDCDVSGVLGALSMKAGLVSLVFHRMVAECSLVVQMLAASLGQLLLAS